MLVFPLESLEGKENCRACKQWSSDSRSDVIDGQEAVALILLTLK